MLNKTCIEKMGKHRRRFFWAGKKEEEGLLYGEVD
jgi:hypothetical protein